MKVLCIDDKDRPNDGITGGWSVKEGNTYTVVNSFISDLDIYCYEIGEDPDRDELGRRYGFAADRFVPTSGIDEREMERNYERQTELV